MRFKKNMVSGRVLKNAVYLFMAQGFNLVYPVVTLPFLTHSLGLKAFGIYALCQVITFYAQSVVDYGFNLTATRLIANAQGDKEQLSKVFFSVIAAKAILAAATALVAVLVLMLLDVEREVFLLYVFSLLTLIGTVFYPIWFFQGLESVAAIAWANFFSKLVGLGLLIILINGPDDIAVSGLVNSIPMLIAALVGLLIVFKSQAVSITKVSFADIKSTLFDGWHVFTANISSITLTNAGSLALGFYHPPEIVGLYNAGERIAKAAAACLSPITQAIYPTNVKGFAKSMADGFTSVGRSSVIVLVPAALVAAILYISAPLVINLLHWDNAQYVHVIRMLCPWIFLGILNNVLGIQILTAMGHSRTYGRLFVFATVISALILVLFVPDFGIEAVILSMTIAEGGLSILFSVAIWKSYVYSLGKVAIADNFSK